MKNIKTFESFVFEGAKSNSLYDKIYNMAKAGSGESSSDVVYLGGDKLSIGSYKELTPYSAQVTGDKEFKVSFSDSKNRTQVIFTTNVKERTEDRTSHDKYGGLIYVSEPMTDKIAGEIMKKVSRFSKTSENLEESISINDPVLMSIRASKEDRKKRVEAQAERMKKRVYGKQREKLEDELWSISIDLKDAYAERRNIYNDMESEAGEKGNEWSDDDANRYGSRLNLVDDEIESLLKKRQQIEIKLAY
jgi:hypothetical protein